MVETTTHDAEMTREETAEYLRTLADELSSGEGRVDVPVGNKSVQLSPPDTVSVDVSVTERSRRLRKDTEELSLQFAWAPTKDTAESEVEAGR